MGVPAESRLRGGGMKPKAMLFASAVETTFAGLLKQNMCEC